MMDIKAYDVGTGYLFRVHLDTTQMIPDPALSAPIEGEVDTRPLIPDPAWVVEYTWGKDQDIQVSKRETIALAELELVKRLPPTPIDI